MCLRIAWLKTMTIIISLESVWKDFPLRLMELKRNYLRSLSLSLSAWPAIIFARGTRVIHRGDAIWHSNMSREVTRDEVRSVNLIRYVIFHQRNDDAGQAVMKFYAFFTCRAWHPAARRPADERGEREESREERAVPAARTRVQSVEQRSPYALEDARRTLWGRRRNVDTRAKITAGGAERNSI